MPLTTALASPDFSSVFDHRDHPCRCAAVQWTAHGADGPGQRRRHVRTRRRDHASGERRRVHAVLGGRHPVGVYRLDMLGVGLTLPARHESRCHRGAFVDHPLGNRRLIDAARRLCDVRQRHHRRPGQLVAGCLVVDVQQRRVSPDRGQHRQAGLHVDADIAAVDRQRERLRGRQGMAEPAVDQQRPHVAEGDLLVDQILDVHAAVPQRAPVLVRFSDLGGEGDDAFQPLDEALRYARRRSHGQILAPAFAALTTGR